MPPALSHVAAAVLAFVYVSLRRSGLHVHALGVSVWPCSSSRLLSLCVLGLCWDALCVCVFFFSLLPVWHGVCSVRLDFFLYLLFVLIVGLYRKLVVTSLIVQMAMMLDGYVVVLGVSVVLFLFFVSRPPPSLLSLSLSLSLSRSLSFSFFFLSLSLSVSRSLSFSLSLSQSLSLSIYIYISLSLSLLFFLLFSCIGAT